MGKQTQHALSVSMPVNRWFPTVQTRKLTALPICLPRSLARVAPGCSHTGRRELWVSHPTTRSPLHIHEIRGFHKEISLNLTLVLVRRDEPRRLRAEVRAGESNARNRGRSTELATCVEVANCSSKDSKTSRRTWPRAPTEATRSTQRWPFGHQ